MDLNSIHLAGWVGKSGIKDTKIGPLGWFQLKLQSPKGLEKIISPHNVFVSMPLMANSSEKTQKNRVRFGTILEGHFIALWGCKIRSFTKHNENKISRRLNGNILEFLLKNDAASPINIATFAGKIVKAPTNQWFELHTKHRPGPKAKPEDPWPVDSIKLYFPNGTDQLRVGHHAFVTGELSGRTPAGKEELIIVVNNFFTL